MCYFNRNNSFSSFRVFFSDEENDEDQRGLYYLPAAPEIDDPEETWNPDVSTFLLIFFSINTHIERIGHVYTRPAEFLS